MRRALRYNVFSVFLMLLMVMFLMSSCATIGQQAPKEQPIEVKVWAGLKISIAAYDASMKSLAQLYAERVIPVAVAQKVWDAGEIYYTAQKGAILALRTYVEVKNAPNQDALYVAIGQAAIRLAKFTPLVAPYLSKSIVDDLNKAQSELKLIK